MWAHKSFESKLGEFLCRPTKIGFLFPDRARPMEMYVSSVEFDIWDLCLPRFGLQWFLKLVVFALCGVFYVPCMTTNIWV